MIQKLLEKLSKPLRSARVSLPPLDWALPSQDVLRQIRPGQFLRVCVAHGQSLAPVRLRLTSQAGSRWSGYVAEHRALVRAGTRLSFHPLHVVDIEEVTS